MGFVFEDLKSCCGFVCDCLELEVFVGLVLFGFVGVFDFGM